MQLIANVPDANQPKGKRFDAAKTQEEGEKYNKKKKEWRASRNRGNGRKEREEITATGPQ